MGGGRGLMMWVDRFWGLMVFVSGGGLWWMVANCVC